MCPGFEGSVPLDVARETPIDVLFVGADEVLLETIPNAVEAESDRIHATTALTAGDALDRLEGGDVDCLVTAQDLPDGQGIELLDVAVYQDPPVTTILYPDGVTEDVAGAAIERGADDLVPRGGERDDPAVLAQRIHHAVEGRRARRTANRAFKSLAAAREGVSILDGEGYFVYVNDAYCELAGYDRQTLLGSHWELLYPEGHEQRVYDDILPTVHDRQRWDGETVYERADGSRSLVSHALTETADGDLICLARDMANQATEQELQRHRHRLDAFVEQVDQYAIFMLDADGFVVSWNDGARRITEYETEEILGDPYETFFTEAERKQGRPQALLETAKEEGSASDEGWRLRSDGSRFWADATLTAYYEDGDLRGFVKVTEDCTERRKLRQELESERAFFAEAIDALQDVFYVLDPDGSIQMVNEQAVAATGYAEDELESMDAWDIFDPDDTEEVADAIDSAVETGTDTTQLSLQRADGSLVPYEFHTSTITNEDGGIEALVGIARDVSEQIEREERIAVLNRILRHNLRNKLTTIVGQGMTIEARTVDDELRDAAADVVAEGNALLDIAETARTFHDLRTREPVEETIDLAGLLEDLCATLSERYPDVDVTLELGDLPSIESDRHYLAFALRHVLVNAVEHNEGDDPHVTVSGRVPDADGRAIIEVRDDGPGIPAAELEAVESGTEDPLRHGTGIGLFAIQWSMHAIGASVHFQNVDHGSLVSVEL